MTITDTISDALTRIRNALKARHSLVVLNKSRVVLEIVKILKEEGYIEDFITKKAGSFEEIHIALKYDDKGEPVMQLIERVSKPGRRIYRGQDALPEVLGGLGIAIISTSRGIMTSQRAKQIGLGGEILCQIY
ncbi:MAG: 30S ribosomal protein S8 [Acidobacteria bacterium]|nr:30S ribosomal protein S8 [Acidobacteriota bacterium]